MKAYLLIMRLIFVGCVVQTAFCVYNNPVTVLIMNYESRYGGLHRRLQAIICVNNTVQPERLCKSMCDIERVVDKSHMCV